MRVALVRTAALTVLFCALIGDLSAADKIEINVRQSDAAIRRQLLSLTPVGTPIKEVYQFLQSRLNRESRVVGWPPRKPGERFGNFIYIHLGHCYEPLSLFPTVVQPFWYFDEHDKLRDVRVRRGVSGL
jgi:hypothetical protein